MAQIKGIKRKLVGILSVTEYFPFDTFDNSDKYISLNLDIFSGHTVVESTTNFVPNRDT